MTKPARELGQESSGIEVHVVEPRDRGEDGFLYFACPACPAYIRRGFLPGSDPQMMIHEKGDGCRLVVDTDPRGSEHRIMEVPPGAGRLEDVVLRCMEDEERMKGRTTARVHHALEQLSDSGGGE